MNETRKCPTCKKRLLQPGRFGTSPVDLDVCRKCRGIWFDQDEFQRVFKIAAFELRCETTGRPTRWKCPCCSRSLRRTTYPQTDVQVLMCLTCNGVWTQPEHILTIRRQRHHLKRIGKLRLFAPVTGFKGRCLAYVNQRVATLQKEHGRHWNNDYYFYTRHRC